MWSTQGVTKIKSRFCRVSWRGKSASDERDFPAKPRPVDSILGLHRARFILTDHVDKTHPVFVESDTYASK